MARRRSAFFVFAVLALAACDASKGQATRRDDEEDYIILDSETTSPYPTYSPTVTAWPTITPYPSYVDEDLAMLSETQPPAPYPDFTPQTPNPVFAPVNPYPAPGTTTPPTPYPGYPANPYPAPGTTTPPAPYPGYPANPYPAPGTTTPPVPYPGYTPQTPYPVYTPPAPYTSPTPPSQNPIGDDDFVPTKSPGPTVADGPDSGFELAPTPNYYPTPNYNPPNYEPNPYPVWQTTPLPTAKYVPPNDDFLATENDDVMASEWADKNTLEKAGAEWDEIRRDKNVKIVSIVFGVTGFVFLLCVAQQLLENPDGCCGKLCRCLVACFKILCFPLRACCCNSKLARERRTHQLVGSEYSHDLELT